MERRAHSTLTWFDQFDSLLLASVFLLSMIGIIMVFNAGAFRSEAATDFSYLLKHLTRFALGLIAMIFMASLDYHKLRITWINWGVLMLGFGLILVTVLMAQTGVVGSRAGANRWLQLSFFPVQPVEIVKVGLVLFLAKHLSGGFDRLRRRGRFFWLVLALPPAVAVALALQPNYGNAAVMLFIFVCMLYLGGLPLHIVTRLLIAFPVLIVAGYFLVPKIHNRVDMWWRCLVHGEAVYQVEQSLIGIGAGGLHGVGFGNGHQRFFLPDQHTDFIFAVLGEETGLLGVLLVLALFLVFAWRGFRIARRCGDNFGYLLASGLTILILVYAGVNIGMVSGMLPVMGLPLPFISYGGSALITNMAMVGILLNIDKQGRQPLPGKQTA